MNEFNNMTIMAALEVIESFHSHPKLEGLEIEWNIQGRCRTDSKTAHIVDLAKIAIDENPDVLTPDGKMKLERAIIGKALKAPLAKREGDMWKKLVAGLRMDGFDLHEEEQETTAGNFWNQSETKARLTLMRMLPSEIPGLDFHASENEIIKLLSQYGMNTPKGHLGYAISAFSRGEWASANGQLRTFYESYLDEIAIALGCEKILSSKDKRDYLGKCTPPFLLEDLNEWNSNIQKPQYIQGLMSRMHPEGSHAGLSDEDDCTFRLQVTLITARLLLRRFEKRQRQV